MNLFTKMKFYALWSFMLSLLWHWIYCFIKSRRNYVYVAISVFCHLFFQDTFFYSLVYDPSVKTLLADKGEIRVGPRYQADIPEMLLEGMFFFEFQILWKQISLKLEYFHQMEKTTFRPKFKSNDLFQF